MVGVSRFELLTSRPPGVRATTAPNPDFDIIADFLTNVKEWLRACGVYEYLCYNLIEDSD